jgi:hypothetical protein
LGDSGRFEFHYLVTSSHHKNRHSRRSRSGVVIDSDGKRLRLSPGRQQGIHYARAATRCGAAFVETSVTGGASGARIGALIRRSCSSSRLLSTVRELKDAKLCSKLEFSRHEESAKTKSLP